MEHSYPSTGAGIDGNSNTYVMVANSVSEIEELPCSPSTDEEEQDCVMAAAVVI